MATQEMKNQDLVAKLASRLEQARGFPSARNGMRPMRMRGGRP